MKIKLAARLKGVTESSTLKMNTLAKELAAQGKKVINLTAGEPDFPAQKQVKDAAVAAIQSDFSKYTPVSGIPDLRKAIAQKFDADNQLKYDPSDIIVTVGAKQAIFNALLAVVNAGDEVLIPTPYWVSYPDMVRIAGGKPVFIKTNAKARFKVNPAQLKKAITKRTKVLILNSPSNPTGTLYSEDELRALAKVLEKTKVLVISDEIYEKLVFDGRFSSFAALSADAFSRTITVNGFSKTHAITGWRLGYAAGPKEIIAAMALLQGQSTSNANSVAQKAALSALTLPESTLRPMVDAFRRRRDRMAEILSHCRDFSFVLPDGAFYLFLNIEALKGKRYTDSQGSKKTQGSEDFAFYLLNRAQVVTVPGDGFGAPWYLRLSFAVSDADVEEGAKRIVQAVTEMK